MTPLAIANLFLLILALFALLIAVVPVQEETCWLPPNAPTRGIYAKCWTYEEIVT